MWVQGGIEDKDFDNVECIYYMNKGISEIENRLTVEKTNEYSTGQSTKTV